MAQRKWTGRGPRIGDAVRLWTYDDDEERPGPDVGPVVGLAEVAELLCVQPTTAYQWRTRGLLPEPDMTVSRQPAWWLSTIQGWAAATGRA